MQVDTLDKEFGTEAKTCQTVCSMYIRNQYYRI